MQNIQKYFTNVYICRNISTVLISYLQRLITGILQFYLWFIIPVFRDTTETEYTFLHDYLYRYVIIALAIAVDQSQLMISCRLFQVSRRSKERASLYQETGRVS